MICLTWHRVLNYCDNSLSWMKHEPARKKQNNCHETDSLLYLYFFRRSLEIHPCRRLRNTHGRERFYASTISTSFIIKFYSRLLALNICWGVTRANVLCMFFFSQTYENFKSDKFAREFLLQMKIVKCWCAAFYCALRIFMCSFCVEPV